MRSSNETTSSVVWQPRQQAPPDDDAEVQLPSPFPSPPPELSCPTVADIAAIRWPSVSPDSMPLFANVHAVKQNCPNFTQSTEAVLQSADSDVCPETDIDSVLEANDAENMNSMLALIRRGIKLRKTVTSDRSAPKLN